MTPGWGCSACSQSSHKRQGEEMAGPAPHVAGSGSGCLFMFCSISSSMSFCCGEDIAKALRERIQDRMGKETVVPDHEVLTYGLCMCLQGRGLPTVTSSWSASEERHQDFQGDCGTLETTCSKGNHCCSTAMLEMAPGHFGGRNQKSWLFLYKIPYNFWC